MGLRGAHRLGRCSGLCSSLLPADCPSSMERSTSARRWPAIWELHSRPSPELQGCSNGSENSIHSSNLMFPPGSWHLGHCYLSLSLSLTLWTDPRLSLLSVFKWKHIFFPEGVEAVVRSVCWSFCFLAFAREVEGQDGSPGGSKPSSERWNGIVPWDSAGHWPWTSKTSMDGPLTTAGDLCLSLDAWEQREHSL